MTTHNLEQIARETAEAAWNEWWTTDQRASVPEAFTRHILAALRSVAPQPAKTEEVSTKPTDAQRAEWHPAAATRDVALSRLQTLGRRLRYRGDEYNADIAELELVPYLRTDREPCQDTARLEAIADLAWKHGGDLEMGATWLDELNKPGTTLDAIRRWCDAAASANDGRARG